MLDALPLAYTLLGTRVPPWVLKADGVAASLMFDFTNWRAWDGTAGRNGTPDSFLTTTRASTGYRVNPAGSYESIAANVLRSTFDFSTFAPYGAHIEGTRINSIRNNAAITHTAGSPGTLPSSGWGMNTGTATRTINTSAGATLNGIEYIEFNMNGTTSTTETNINFDSTTSIAAVEADVWSGSCWMQVTLDSANITDIRLELIGLTGGGAETGRVFTSVYAGRTTWQRHTLIYSAGLAATTDNILPRLRLLHSSGVEVNITIRVGWPQCELGASVTSPIRTTTAAATRSTDNVQMVLPTALQNLAAYSVLAIGIPHPDTAYVGNQSLVSLSTGASADRISVRRTTVTNPANANVLVGAVAQYSQAGATWAQETRGKLAIAGAANNNRGCFNGTLMSATQTNTSFPSAVDVFFLGANGVSSGEPWFGTIESVAVWPFRVSNGELQRLTA